MLSLIYRKNSEDVTYLTAGIITKVNGSEIRFGSVHNAKLQLEFLL